MPRGATHQCPAVPPSVPPISAAQQCHPSVLPVSAHQCRQSVPAIS
ncbi:unnamed protein product, partial [Staurois parvus]